MLCNIVTLANLFCGAWRLAKFNSLDRNQSKTFFEGLPIPGAGGVIASTVLVFQRINFGPE